MVTAGESMVETSSASPPRSDEPCSSSSSVADANHDAGIGDLSPSASPPPQRAKRELPDDDMDVDDATPERLSIAASNSDPGFVSSPGFSRARYAHAICHFVWELFCVPQFNIVKI